jgi:hypothetical protein
MGEASMQKKILGSLVVILLALTGSAQFVPDSGQQGAVPAYNARPPKKGEKLPPILPKEHLWGPNFQYPYQTHAYQLAGKIPNTIYQQPCYCYCDRMGHKSLHSCFESDHAAHCSACLKELYYSYNVHKQHKSARQIRQGIIRGEWQQVNLETAASIN